MTNDDRKLRARVKRMADDLGEVQAAAKLGISTTAMLRLLAGRDVRRGTLALVREALGPEPATQIR